MTLAPARVRAQTDPGATSVEAVIEIQRAPGSQACPDKEAVFRSIQRLFPEREFHQGSTGTESTARAHVTIHPRSPGHEAVLTLLPPRHGERVIREEDADCRGLADALALAFVMLVAPPDAATESSGASSNSNSNSNSNPDAKSAPASPPAALEATRAESRGPSATERVPETRHPTRPFRAGLGASLVGGLGVLSEPALGAGGELELFHERGFGLSLQGLRLWALPTEAQGGSVTLTLWGLLVAPCYRLRLAGTGRFDACLRIGLGSQHARVAGFEAAQSGNYPWQVLVPSLGYRHGLPGLGERLSGFVRVGLVAQLRPQSFSLRREDTGENVPIAGAPTFGVMTDIGLVFGTGPF
ncbi:MAG TPA: hypothetical protein VHM25_01025 [Polyangiaceae bacterium]|nr:hypothetical protein [Polyangiaceae bacterium]